MGPGRVDGKETSKGAGCALDLDSPHTAKELDP